MVTEQKMKERKKRKGKGEKDIDKKHIYEVLLLTNCIILLL